MERVENLVSLLLYTNNSLEYACEQLGFNEFDLTEREESELYDRIFQCGYCGYWHENCEEEYSHMYGPVCSGCYSELEEEENED